MSISLKHIIRALRTPQGVLRLFIITLLLVAIGCDDSFDEAMHEENDQATETGTSTLIPGNNGIVTIKKIEHNEIELSWTKAVDNITNSDELEYAIYGSTDTYFASVEEAEAGGTLYKDWTQDINDADIKLLTPETTYYFLLIVRDEDFNKSAYLAISAQTAADDDED
ncbi:MAG: fibronectin type III domain-containing protein [bacterium]|nr:fibronectin type III domain-containing protein [bacterium]